MKLLEHILTSIMIIALASCQSVNYHGKSYDKNGFFHCMVLEDSEIESYGYVTDEEKAFCSNYKEKLQKIVSNFSLSQEKNYYEQYGAKCEITPENNSLQCVYNTKYDWISAYYTKIYEVLTLDILSNKFDVLFAKQLKNCRKVEVEQCESTVFTIEQEFTINKNK